MLCEYRAELSKHTVEDHWVIETAVCAAVGPLADAPMLMRHVARSMAAHRRLLHDLPRKSSTCFGRATGQALTEYETRDAAEEGALHAGARSGSNWLAPYLCSSCGMWHLAPTHSVRRAPTPCVCVSGSGKPKALYVDWGDAQRQCDRIRADTGSHVVVYECDRGLGYHLTKRRY